MLGDDAVADGQAEARPAPRRLRGEERLEDLRKQLFLNPAAGIDELDEQLVAALGVEAAAQREDAARLHGVHGVQHQGHEALNQSLTVAFELRQPGRELADHGESLEVAVVLEQEQRLVQQGVYVHVPRVAGLGT